jgi:hypothetical protein
MPIEVREIGIRMSVADASAPAADSAGSAPDPCGGGGGGQMTRKQRRALIEEVTRAVLAELRRAGER